LGRRGWIRHSFAPLGTQAPGSRPTPTSVKVSKWEGVTTGIPANSVLPIHPKSEAIAGPEMIGEDDQELIIKWPYTEADLIMA
jgi:hypothetical protein